MSVRAYGTGALLGQSGEEGSGAGARIPAVTLPRASAGAAQNPLQQRALVCRRQRNPRRRSISPARAQDRPRNARAQRQSGIRYLG